MMMVGTTGFEPATPASRTLCSTRLSHVPTQYIVGSFKMLLAACQLKNITLLFVFFAGIDHTIFYQLVLKGLLKVIVSSLPGPTEIISTGVSERS